MKYTVVVLYSKRLAPDYPAMSYVAMVEADNWVKARQEGARCAWSAQSPSERGKLVEWLPLVVLEGHLHVAGYAWQMPAWLGALNGSR